MNIKAKIINAITKLIAKLSGGVAQDESGMVVAGEITPGMPELIRNAACEGAVLLKNVNNVLPLKRDNVVSVFGRVQIDYFFTGYGSGGDVKKPYVVSLLDGLRNNSEIKINEELASIYEKWTKVNEVDHGFWAHWPSSVPDMKLTDDIVRTAQSKSDTAIIVLGRSSGEDQENRLEKGSYYLTDAEYKNIDKVTQYFNKVIIVLNIGSIIDFSWVEKYQDKISSIIIAWQGGMESGNAIADLLSGKVNPSGRLSDTIAKKYDQYPSSKTFGKLNNNYEDDIYVGYRYFETFNKDAVLYPFGFGLSYSSFDISVIDTMKKDDSFEFTCEVKNIGEVAGKEVIQLYLQKPCNLLGNPYRILVGYAKTDVIPVGENARVVISVNKEMLSSYDAKGVSGYKSAYIIESGDYIFSVGKNVRDAKNFYTYKQNSIKLFKQLQEVMAPKERFNIIVPKMVNGEYVEQKEQAPTFTTNLKQIILDNLPKETAITGDKGIKLVDVKDGKASMDEFVAQFSLEELEAISRGDYTMDSPLGASGNAGALGGVLPSLRDKGVPPMITTDGPSGIRLYSSCSLIPIGTLLACTFNTKLVQELHEGVSGEMKNRGSDILLAPGMNIHRTPLCGRNFEYYSEDPILSGTIAAAAVKGTQINGASACPKHFACNNQEYKRTITDSRVSERALREIYLKGFEICINLAMPKNIMTSYNKINGVWNHYNYELCNTILRKEWGYDGNVMTDWWMQYSKSQEFPNIRDQAYRVRSRVNVFMPGNKRIGAKKPDGTLLETYGKVDGITLGELQQNAKDVLSYIIKTSKI